MSPVSPFRPTSIPSSLSLTDAANRESGKSAVKLSADELQSFLYARATDSGIRLQATRRLWIDGRLEEVAR